jgi:hypothetical protein
MKFPILKIRRLGNILFKACCTSAQKITETNNPGNQLLSITKRFHIEFFNWIPNSSHYEKG